MDYITAHGGGTIAPPPPDYFYWLLHPTSTAPATPKTDEPDTPLDNPDVPTVPKFDNTALAIVGIIDLDLAPADTVGVGEVVQAVVTAVGLGIWMYQNQEAISYNVSSWWDSLFTAKADNAAQDEPLSEWEVGKLVEGEGQTAEEIKAPHGKGAGKLGLFKDPKGNVIVKPLSGNGPGEPTGFNINDY